MDRSLEQKYIIHRSLELKISEVKNVFTGEKQQSKKYIIYIYIIYIYFLYCTIIWNNCKKKKKKKNEIKRYYIYTYNIIKKDTYCTIHINDDEVKRTPTVYNNTSPIFSERN